MRDLWAALRKDLLLQWRGRAQLVAIFAFGAAAQNNDVLFQRQALSWIGPLADY